MHLLKIFFKQGLFPTFFSLNQILELKIMPINEIKIIFEP